MKEKEIVSNEFDIHGEEVETKEISIDETILKKSKNNFNSNKFKTKKCKVIAYHNHTNTLDVKFNEYGIRIKDIKDFSGDIAIVKYKGEIGKSNFEYKL